MPVQASKSGAARRAPAEGLVPGAGADIEAAAETLSALAHPTRLGVFRVLAAAAPETLRAGVIAEKVDVAPSTLTQHLHVLERAGLIARHAHGRERLYAVESDAIAGLLQYLIADCCGGRPELCGGAVARCEPGGVGA